MSEFDRSADYFSEEELENLGNLAQAFFNVRSQPPTLDHVGVEETGDITSVQSSWMPEYVMGNRRVAIEGATAMSPHEVTINLLDFMGEGSTRIAVGRQLILDAEGIRHAEYRDNLQTIYSEIPLDQNDKVIPARERSSDTPLQVHYFRPFTQADYADMVEILSQASET